MQPLFDQKAHSGIKITFKNRKIVKKNLNFSKNKKPYNFFVFWALRTIHTFLKYADKTVIIKEGQNSVMGTGKGSGLKFSLYHRTHCTMYIHFLKPWFWFQSELAAFYRDADVALVTPLRDGMNLVAKEFVACRVKEPGVLILSPFAGAGEMMHEALRVNPYEIGNVAEVLNRALTMPTDEREVRMHALRMREKQHDVNHWTKSFLRNIGTLIEEDGEEVLPTTMQPVSVEDFNSYLAPYVGDQAILALLLDYDGTLAPIAKHPDLAIIPTETRNVLDRLARRPDVNISIISGRSVQNVKNMVGIEGITYAGNHGMEIVHADGSTFVHPMPSEYKAKLDILQKSLNQVACKDGAWIEDKGVLLCFHYREVPIEKREAIVSTAKKMISEAGFKVCQYLCLKFPENFPSKSRSNLLDCTYGSFSQAMEQITWPFQAHFFNALFDRFPSKLSLTTNHLLENVV